MIAAGLTLIGFYALAAAMPRHAPTLLGPWDGRIRPPAWRALGWCLLLAGLAASLCAQDWPRALVGWFGMLPLGAGCVLLGLTYDVRIARGAAALGAVAVVAGVLA